MILENINKEILGYNSQDLSKHSNKLIFACCDMCGNVRLLQKNGYSRICFDCTRTLKQHKVYTIYPNLPYIEPELLLSLYLGNNYTIREIAGMFNVSSTFIRHRLEYFNSLIKTKSSYSNHIILSTELLEIIEGELLGDGCLLNHKLSGTYHHGSKYNEYISWISKTLSNFGINQSGKNCAVKVKCNNNIFNMYHYTSRRYVELKNLHHRWYLKEFKYCPYCEIIFHSKTVNMDNWKNKRKCPICNNHDMKRKIVPCDLKITPLMLRQWYIGDGSLARNKKSFSLTLASMSFLKSHVRHLIRELEMLGFKCHHNKRNTISISVYSIIDFFSYIGTCPKEIRNIYGYKWISDKEFDIIKFRISRLDKINSTYRNKDWLIEQYITNNKSILEISREFNLCSNTIREWLKKLNIVKSKINNINIMVGDDK